MDGTNRTRIDRSRAGLRLGGCIVLGAGLSLVPANPLPVTSRQAQQVVVLAATPLMPEARKPSPAKADPRPPALAMTTRQPALPVQVAAIVPEPQPVVPAPDPAPELALVPPPAGQPLPVAAPPLRKVDIAQVADEMPRSLHVPQLREPGLVAGAPPTLAAKVDAMQVPLPAPPQLAREERAALLAEAPSEMTVRIGGDAVGKVAFRTTETGSFDVQLSGLLDLVADRMAPEEYTRLRNSAATSSFVPLDQLRAIGLSLRYDPVYDELEISA